MVHWLCQYPYAMYVMYLSLSVYACAYLGSLTPSLCYSYVYLSLSLLYLLLVCVLCLLSWSVSVSPSVLVLLVVCVDSDALCHRIVCA